MTYMKFFIRTNMIQNNNKKKTQTILKKYNQCYLVEMLYNQPKIRIYNVYILAPLDLPANL